MDFKVVFTEPFCSDLEEILEHIAAQDPTAAGVRVTILHIPTSSEVGLDVAAYNQARLVLHTHFVRSGYLQNARR